MTTTPAPPKPPAGYRNLLWLIFALILLCIACGTVAGWGAHDMMLPDVG